MNKEIKKYLKELKKLFPVRGKREKQYIADIQRSATDLFIENKTVTYEILCQEIGSPKELIINYFNEIDYDYLKRKLKFTNRIRYVLIIIIGLSVLLFGIRLFLAYESYLASVDQIITEKVVVIE